MSHPTHNGAGADEDHGGGLRVSLGMFTVAMLVVGGVIGSGIFRKPGVMAAQLGSPFWLMVVWIVAGIVTLMGVLTVAEMAGMMPETGGQYTHFERVFGRFFAFLYGWSIFAVIQTGSIAAVAHVFAEYGAAFVGWEAGGGAWRDWSIHLPLLGTVAPLKDWEVKTVAALLILGLTWVNFLGVKLGGWVQDFFTVAKVAAMLALVLLAFVVEPSTGVPAAFAAPPALEIPQGWAFLAAMAAALQGAFWAYDGWNKVPYIAGEVRDAARVVPRALCLGMLGVTVVYLLMNLAYLHVLPIGEMAGVRLVAAEVAERCVAGGGKWISALVMVSTFGACNAIILASARVYYSMARRGVFPAWLGGVHPSHRTPAAALWLQCLWSLGLLFTGTFDSLTDTLIFVSWFFYIAAAAAVIAMRRREPLAHRPHRVPGYPWIPLGFIAFATVFLLLTIGNDWIAWRKTGGLPNFVVGSLLVLLGLPVYFWCRRSPALPPPNGS